MAFGRLRGLHLGQSVSFFASQEVDQSIRMVLDEANECPDAAPDAGGNASGEATQCNSMDVVLWTTVNTVKSIDNELVLWAHQGAMYSLVGGNPLRAQQNVVNDLVKCYGSPLESKKVAKIVEDVVEMTKKQIAKAEQDNSHGSGIEDSETYKNYLEDIVKKGKDFGGARRIECSVLDTEVERELQKEEEEEFVRIKPPPEAPAVEQPWKYHSIFCSQTLLSDEPPASSSLSKLSCVRRRC